MTERYYHEITECRYGWVWDCRRGSILGGGLVNSRHAAISECLKIRQQWSLWQQELKELAEEALMNERIEFDIHEKEYNRMAYREEDASYRQNVMRFY